MGTKCKGSFNCKIILHSKFYKFGDFNNWDRDTHKCNRDAFGVWSIVLPKNADGTLPIKH